MPRLRLPRPAKPRSLAFAVAAGMWFGAIDATAQTPPPDQLATPPVPGYSTTFMSPSELEANQPASRFEKFRRPQPVRPSTPPSPLAQRPFLASPSAIEPPPALAPLPSGAGKTGFDSSNKKKKKPARAKPGTAAADAAPQPDTAAGALASAKGQGAPPEIPGPIRKPPPKRKPKDTPDPYDPLGIKSGSMLYYPAIELVGGHDSNPSHSPNGKGSLLYTVAPELVAQSDWSRHEFKADLRGSYTGYQNDQTPSLSRPYFNGKLDGRIDVTRDTRINLEGRLRVGTDDPGSPNLQAGLARLPVFATFGGDAGIAHSFNRFELSAKATAERTEWQRSSLVDGTTASNADRNYDQYGGTLRGSYEFSPAFKPFVEVAADKRVHDLNVDLSGFRRDSSGSTAKIGSTFEFSRLLTGEASVGYLQRTYEDPRLPRLAGMIADGTLIWTPSALTTVKLTARSTVTESTVPDVAGIFSRDLGAQLDHSFRRWLIGTLKAGYGTDDYVGSPRDDRRYYLGAGITYKFNREVQLKGEVRHDWLRSNVKGVDYNATLFLLGLRLQR